MYLYSIWNLLDVAANLSVMVPLHLYIYTRIRKYLMSNGITMHTNFSICMYSSGYVIFDFQRFILSYQINMIHCNLFEYFQYNVFVYVLSSASSIRILSDIIHYSNTL